MFPQVSDVAVIGAGPAGLMAAQVLAEGGSKVTIYERMPSAGRKFLMAGRGGLNLTHSEPIEHFLSRYGPAAKAVAPWVEAFSPGDLIAWAEGLGQPTFVGSSGRVFPKALKASPLLRAWLARLNALGVVLQTRHDWQGWDAQGRLRFETPEVEVTASPTATLLALGGASWPKLGSTGSWAPILAEAGVATRPLKPANAGFDVAWSDVMRERFAGQPRKGIALTCGNIRVRGEAMVTRHGLEGGAVYALSTPLREAIETLGSARLWIDLRPAAGLFRNGRGGGEGRAGVPPLTAREIRPRSPLGPSAARDRRSPGAYAGGGRGSHSGRSARRIGCPRRRRSREPRRTGM